MTKELNEDKLKERLEVLEGDIKKVSEQMVSLDKQKTDAIAMLNALNGAKQQCINFLKEISDEDQEGQEASSDASKGDDS
tara:strand:- start:1007 stop:1246 length:240 start_codon:yes stop_codon:yes gene_type:complete